MAGVRIIIVEDEPLVALDLKRQLEKTGFEVIQVFESGEEILEFLNQEQPDIILMDIQLFGALDGIDTAHQINKNYEIPILFLTANTDKTTFNRAKLTFPHAFLSKPFIHLSQSLFHEKVSFQSFGSLLRSIVVHILQKRRDQFRTAGHRRMALRKSQTERHRCDRLLYARPRPRTGQPF